MRERNLRVVPALLSCAIACGCEGPPNPAAAEGAATTMSPQLEADLREVRRGRVYFYHHSVGVNVLAGIEALDGGAAGGRIRAAWLEEGGADLEGPALIHGGGGRNGDPVGKMEFFAQTIRGRPRLAPSLAFMKLCYVDFTPSTDVAVLFERYRTTIEALKREHPEIKFAHVTTPLMRRPNDLKASIRRLLGREVWDDAANLKRAEYNRKLRETFAADPILDLARLEATGPDGAEVASEYRGQRVPSLHPAYTDDGGHLNAVGQRLAGEAGVHFMADALRSGAAAR